MSKSYDLSTSSKWANLADGEHVVKLRARGAGYGSSSFSNSVTVAKGVAMPVKGDLITIESKQYRVLKTNGSVAEVLAMYDAASRSFDNLSYGHNNTYAGKSLDTYCNNSFYNGLSSAMKSAIVDKTFMQDSWSGQNTVSAYYTGISSITTPNAYYLNLVNTFFGSSITRHCYALSVQDIIDYLEVTTSMSSTNTTLTDINLWKMFWNQTTSAGSSYVWLRSARSNDHTAAFIAGGGKGNVHSTIVTDSLTVRPAFQIDLSKIEWTPVGG